MVKVTVMTRRQVAEPTNGWAVTVTSAPIHPASLATTGDE